MGLIGKLSETGMTSNTTLLSSKEFMVFYIAGNSPFNFRGYSYWRRAKATRFHQEGIILLIHHFHVDHKAKLRQIVLIVIRILTSIVVYTPPPQKKKNAQQLSSMCLDDCNTLEKSKTMVMQILVGTQAQGALWSICKW